MKSILTVLLVYSLIIGKLNAETAYPNQELVGLTNTKAASVDNPLVTIEKQKIPSLFYPGITGMFSIASVLWVIIDIYHYREVNKKYIDCRNSIVIEDGGLKESKLEDPLKQYTKRIIVSGIITIILGASSVFLIHYRNKIKQQQELRQKLKEEYERTQQLTEIAVALPA